MEYIGVIPKDLAIGAFWPQIERLISRALPYGKGEYSLEDVRRSIELGQAFALGVVASGVVEFAVVATPVPYPQKKVLYIQYGAGRGGSRAKEALICAAKALGADWIETRCRPAVARLYEKSGFDTAYQVAILEIQK